MIGIKGGPMGGPNGPILSTVWGSSAFSTGLQNLYSSVRFRPAPPVELAEKSTVCICFRTNQTEAPLDRFTVQDGKRAAKRVASSGLRPTGSPVRPTRPCIGPSESILLYRIRSRVPLIPFRNGREAPPALDGPLAGDQTAVLGLPKQLSFADPEKPRTNWN